MRSNTRLVWNEQNKSHISRPSWCWYEMNWMSAKRPVNDNWAEFLFHIIIFFRHPSIHPTNYRTMCAWCVIIVWGSVLYIMRKMFVHFNRKPKAKRRTREQKKNTLKNPWHLVNVFSISSVIALMVGVAMRPIHQFTGEKMFLLYLNPWIYVCVGRNYRK